MESTLEPMSKFTLCVLRTQLGKTFTAISKIQQEIERDPESGRSIHPVFTMNTLLNNSQFAKRLQSIEDAYGKGSVCVFTSKYDGPYTHVKNRRELLGLCSVESTCPRLVLMCSNKTRFKDGVEFIHTINQSHPWIRRAFAYYDELHNYITDEVRIQIQEIHSLDVVKEITALTASPDKIWQDHGFWSEIKLLPLDDLRSEDYVGCEDMAFHTIDDYYQIPYHRPHPFDFDTKDEETIGFITHVLNRNPAILARNSRSFIPAHVRKKSHDAVRELIFQRNPTAVVVVINARDKSLQFIDHGVIKKIPLVSKDKSEEVCETISRIILHYRLESRPLVITGLLCVGMGQTLAHSSLGSFTSAIFGHLDLTNDEIYQLFGRITGRMKRWKTYTPTQVYCPTLIKNRCVTMETCAKHLLDEHNGEVVTQEDYRQPMIDMGEIGKSAIENIREKKKAPVHVEDPCITVPIVIQITKEQFHAIHGARWNFDALFGCIDPALKRVLKGIDERPVDNECPDSKKDGYQKKVVALVEAARGKKKLKTWVSSEKIKKDDYYVIYLDHVDYKIIVSIYYGSKKPVPS